MQSGGRLGVRESGLLLAIAAKPAATFGNSELYPTIYIKAAAPFEALCNYHVFIDGNKRCSLAVAEYFLSKNSHKLAATKQQKENFTISIATTNPDDKEVAIWIKKHTGKVIT